MALRTTSASRSWKRRLGLLHVQAVDRRASRPSWRGRRRPCVAGRLVGLAIGFGEGGACHVVDAGLQRLLLGGGFGEGPGFLGGMLGQFDDRLDHRLEAGVAEGDGAEHDFLGELLRLGLHHQHAFGGAGDHQVELAALHLVGGRVQDVLAVLIADAGGGDRAEERDAGQRQRGRAADQGDDVGVVLQVVAEHGGDDLDLVAEAVGEQRADRAVDQAGFQDLVLGRAAFALEEAAGDLAGGERLFLVVDGEREEVLAGLGGLHADGGAQHDGVAVAGHDGAIGLAGDLAGFQDQLAAAPVEFLAEVIEHSNVLTDARHRRTAFRSRHRPNWGGRRRLGSHGWRGLRLLEGRAQPRAMWPETPSRIPHLGSPVRRSVGPPRDAAYGGDSRPPRRCPVPPWSGGRHHRARLRAYYVLATHYKVWASGRVLERAVEQHPDGEVV